MQDFDDDSCDDRGVNKQLYGMILDKMAESAVLYDRGILKSGGHQEEKDQGDGQTSVDCDSPAQMLLVVEGKYDAGDPHDHKSNHKCDRNGEKDAENDR